jgi:hypothetical protein
MSFPSETWSYERWNRISALQKLHEDLKNYPTPHVDQQIVDRLLALLQPQLRARLWDSLDAERNPKISDLLTRCRVQLESLISADIYHEMRFSQEESISAYRDCIHFQKETQDIAVRDGLVQRLNRYTDHTKHHDIRQRTWLLPYKFQLSRSDSADYIIPNKSTDVKDLVTYSVFDPQLMPSELMDFCLHGTWRQQYSKLERLELEYDASNGMQDTLKPVLWSYTTLLNEAENSERIVRLTHTDADGIINHAYLLSQHTPQIHEERKKQRWDTWDVRYDIFSSLDEVAGAIEWQVAQSQQKIVTRRWLLALIPDSYESFIAHPWGKDHFVSQLQERIALNPWYTKLDLIIAEKIDRLVDTRLHNNPMAQWAILLSVQKAIFKGIKDREHMINHLAVHTVNVQRLRKG